MSEVNREAGLEKETQQLLNGPLKHVKAAALAAVLVPLASLAAATPASAQQLGCASSGTVCGFVFNDTNKNGVQDEGEPGIEGVPVTISDGTTVTTTETGPDGVFFFFVPEGTYTISVDTPQGTEPSPVHATTDFTKDSDGVPDGLGHSVATDVHVVGSNNPDTDFGFVTKAVLNPGTGTPGYWKNHPDAWPVSTITVGGVTYTKAQAISWLGKVGKDKTTTMFSSLVPAMLNVMIGNDPSCIGSTIEAANTWMATYGPVGSNVPASSAAWSGQPAPVQSPDLVLSGSSTATMSGEALHTQMDNYNNGRLCAPHRQ